MGLHFLFYNFAKLCLPFKNLPLHLQKKKQDLSSGVMVALRILVPPVRVRVLPGQRVCFRPRNAAGLVLPVNIQISTTCIPFDYYMGLHKITLMSGKNALCCAKKSSLCVEKKGMKSWRPRARQKQ